MISEKLRGSINDKLSAGIYVAIHFLVLGVIALVTGQPFLFPSLGPSAYLMATGETDRAEGGYHVIGGHFVAVVTGFIAYHAIAADLVATEELGPETGAFAPEVFLLGASSIVAMVLCTVGMLAAKTNHPAACATTLIVALGLLSGILDIAIIMVSVVILYVLHENVLFPTAKRLGFEPEDPRPKADDG
jgi:hypothetical protein